jgi:6-phosphogluconolactonase
MSKLKLFFALLCLHSLCLAETVNVFFASGGRGSLGIYKSKFNTESGKLSNPVVAAEIKNSNFLAQHPDGRKIYAVAELPEGPAVVGYKVDRKGVLEEFTSSLINDTKGSHISVHPSGKFLLTAQYLGGSVAFFPLNEQGELGEIVKYAHEGASKVNLKRQKDPHPHWTGYSPDGKYAFVPDLGTDNIHIYKVKDDFSGITKHKLAKTIPGGGPRHMRFSIDGKFIYLLNELDLSISTFAYNSEKGEAKLIEVTPALPKEVKEKEVFNSGAEILVHPNGKFIWSSNRGSDSISVFNVEAATGKLSFVESEAVRGCWPRNINLDPSSKWILAAGQFSNTVSVFKINQDTGELTFNVKNLVSLPGPVCILFVD